MALRGNARNYDADGICGRQELSHQLVILKRFSANIRKLFPGAKIEYDGEAAANAQWSVKVTEVLRDTSLPNPLTTSKLGETPERDRGEKSLATS